MHSLHASHADNTPNRTSRINCCLNRCYHDSHSTATNTPHPLQNGNILSNPTAHSLSRRGECIQLSVLSHLLINPDFQTRQWPSLLFSFSLSLGRNPGPPFLFFSFLFLFYYIHLSLIEKRKLCHAVPLQEWQLLLVPRFRFFVVFNRNFFFLRVSAAKSSCFRLSIFFL